MDTAILAEQQYTGQNYYIIIPLLEAVLAAWVIRKSGLKPVIKAVMAMILIALSGGTYAAMVSVAPTLLLVSVIFDILKGGSGKENWTRSLKYVGFFLSGMALYYIVLRVLLVVRGGHLQSYMNENVLESVSGIISMARRIGDAYVNIAVFYAGHNPYLLPSILNKVLPIIVILGVAESLILLITVRDQIRDKLMNGILLIIALMISPAVVNLIYIATLGASFAYPLLLFTYCIPLIAFVRVNELLMDKLRHAKIRNIGYISRAAYIFFIYYSIVMSNSLYISAQQAYIETISIGTRLLDRIETCDGFTGTEEVVLVGCLDKNSYWGHPRDDGAMILNVLCGLNSLNPNGITPTRAVPFLKNTLDSTLTYTVCNTMDDFLRIEDLTDDEKERIMDMPSFPVKGSVEKIGEKIYVKFYELQSTTD